MNKNRLKNLLFMGVSGLVLMTQAQAGTPVWTFAPVSGFPPSVMVSPTGTAIIQYTVTNQSTKSHTLQMKPIQGITPSGCTSPLGYHQSCTLILSVNGRALQGDVTGGPVLCDRGNTSQCYQPSQTNSLAIRLTQQPPVQQYTVTPSAGVDGSISPSTSQVVNSGATLTFTATPNPGYGVNQWLVDGSLAQTGGTTYQLTNITANHTVNVTFGTVTLTPTVSSLALSVDCQPFSSCTTTQNAALTGNPRQITIQNTGSASATNVLVNASGLPSGTSITSNTCSGTLNAGGSCIITLTPGAVASADSSSIACTSGTQPVGGAVTISADGGLSNQVAAYVLSYGCQYQGGFIYSVDDTTPNTGSIGGKVTSLLDQAEPGLPAPQSTSIIWSANGVGGSGDVSYDIIPLISDLSTPNDSYSQAQTTFNATYSNTSTFPFPPSSAFSSCQGATEGACNTNNILVLYNTYITQYGVGGSGPYTLSPGPTNPTSYATGLCQATINAYSDWYMPALCEIVSCFATQNMLTNLSFLIGDPSAATPRTSCSPPSGTDCLAGSYWSSTEYSFNPQFFSMGGYFSTGGSSALAGDKSLRFGVRCSRALTV